MGDAWSPDCQLSSMQFILPTVLLFSYWHWTATDGVSYDGFWRKADSFSARSTITIRCSILRALRCFLFYLVGSAGLKGGSRFAPRLGWAVCIVFTIFLLMPSQIYGGSDVDHRLPTAWFLLLIASSTPWFPTRRFAIAIGSSGSMLVIRTAVIEHVWRQADKIYSADLSRHRCTSARRQARRCHSARWHTAGMLGPGGVISLRWRFHGAKLSYRPSLLILVGRPVALRPSYAALADAATPQAFFGGRTDRRC